MKRRRSSAFESMFKTKVLEEKSKPTRERKILFPCKFEDKSKIVKEQPESVLDISAYREEFERFDINGDGSIDFAEFGDFTRSIGLNPTDDEVRELFLKMDKDDSDRIEFNEFLKILDHPIIRMTKSDIRTSIEDCFRKLVPINNMSMLQESTLSVNQLRTLLTQKGKMKLSDNEVDDLIKKTSPESLRSGSIDYRSIVNLFVKDYDDVTIHSEDVADEPDVEFPDLDSPPTESFVETKSRAENPDDDQSKLITS